MAKQPEAGMEMAELKRMIAAAKNEPVSCAIAVGADSGGLIMMHKAKSPKAVERDLTQAFPDLKLSRFGTASVDEEGTAKLIINKAASGMARRLKKTLKGTGVRKIEILLEDGTVLEGADDEEAEDGEAAAQPNGTANGAQQAAAHPDMTAYDHELRDLIKQIATSGADAGRMQDMKMAAATAVEDIKAGDAANAAEALQTLKGLLKGGGAAKPAPGAVSVNFVAMQKSRLLWDSARKRVASEVASLKKEALDVFADDPEETQVRDALDQLDEITSALDERLLDALDDLLNSKDPAEHAKLLAEANSVLDEYANFVATNELVKKLSGDTPFGTKLTIGPTYEGVIKALQANLH